MCNLAVINDTKRLQKPYTKITETTLKVRQKQKEVEVQCFIVAISYNAKNMFLNPYPDVFPNQKLIFLI